MDMEVCFLKLTSMLFGYGFGAMLMKEMKVVEMKVIEMKVVEMKVMETATISLKVLGTPSCLQSTNKMTRVKSCQQC